jgi:uncharacterized membrane protein
MAEPRREGRLDQPREPRRLTLPRPDAEAFGKWAEAIARFMGTAWFLVYMTVVIVAWIGWNTLAPPNARFDPYTFTFLTLILSLQASYAAPLILLAQNRQADRDRVAMEEDRRRAAMQKADTEYLSREIATLRIALGEVATRDFMRSELVRLVEELDEADQRRNKRLRRNDGRRNDGQGRRPEPAPREHPTPAERRAGRRERPARGQQPPAGEALAEPFDELDDDAGEDSGSPPASRRAGWEGGRGRGPTDPGRPAGSGTPP